MTGFKEYLQELIILIEKVAVSQDEMFDKSAQLIADALESRHMVHFWGPGGHSSIFAEDVLYREGELALINPIIDPSISLGHGAMKEINYFERIEQIGTAAIQSAGISQDDVVVIGSAYGVNPVCIQGALECKKAGAKIVAVTSPAFSDALDNDLTKHESGRSLYQLADYTLNSFSPQDDLLLEMDGFSQKFAPVGTIMQLITLKALTSTVITKLIARGAEVPIWRNALEKGGPEFNEQYMNYIWPIAKSI